MSENSADPQRRIPRRWTVGGIMLLDALVALVALPLAWYVHRVRELNRLQAQADAWHAAVHAAVRAAFEQAQSPPSLSLSPAP